MRRYCPILAGIYRPVTYTKDAEHVHFSNNAFYLSANFMWPPMQSQLDLSGAPDRVLADSDIQLYINPRGHSGIHAFHKYWGKKPADVLRFLVRALSFKGDVVMDPFLGYGSLAYEAALMERRFIGADINPIATAISRFLLFPPQRSTLDAAINEITAECRDKINASYRTARAATASHILWEGTEMRSVWLSKPGQKRVENDPTVLDLSLAKQYDGYIFKHCRPMNMFDNSRINSTHNLVWSDMFTGRAMRNIDVLIERINRYDDGVRIPLMLILSSAVGQMSNMVFAITRRGKTIRVGEPTKTEVGSWVIGYWRPSLHFEVNVWNCFSRRCQRVLTAIKKAARLPSDVRPGTPLDVIRGNALVSLECMDATYLVSDVLPEGSVDLILTDPPHGDRIPYLELSEMWNALLRFDVDWDREIIISNAHVRKKDVNEYARRMGEISELYGRILAKEGLLGLIFNTRNHDLWESVFDGLKDAKFQLIGTVPLRYSATSVVQDNRRGALTEDRLLLYSKGKHHKFGQLETKFAHLPGWLPCP